LGEIHTVSFSRIAAHDGSFSFIKLNTKIPYFFLTLTAPTSDRNKQTLYQSHEEKEYVWVLVVFHVATGSYLALVEAVILHRNIMEEENERFPYRVCWKSMEV